MEKEIILQWIGSYLKREIDQFTFTCLMVLHHVSEKEDVPGQFKSDLVLAMEYLQSAKHFSKKEEQQLNKCLADIIKVSNCEGAELEAVCEAAMEKIHEIIDLFIKKQ